MLEVNLGEYFVKAKINTDLDKIMAQVDNPLARIGSIAKTVADKILVNEESESQRIVNCIIENLQLAKFENLEIYIKEMLK